MEIRLASDISEILDALEIRRQVFVEEQHVSEERERDDYDKEATHFLIEFDDKPVGTARLRWLGKTKCKIERMAILKPYRKNGFGMELVKFIEDYAKRHNVRELHLNSQIHAKEFYGKLGFKPHGKTFMDANIKHIEMIKKLKK